ncbi:MAG: HAD hydrolase-like protein [Pseudomonadota bacterium]
MTRPVIFDLDGTLIDSVPDIAAAANAALAVHGMTPLSMTEARGCVGHGATVFVERARALRGLNADLQEPILEAFLARQFCKGAPWIIKKDDLGTENVINAADQKRRHAPSSGTPAQKSLEL